MMSLNEAFRVVLDLAELSALNPKNEPWWELRKEARRQEKAIQMVREFAVKHVGDDA